MVKNFFVLLHCYHYNYRSVYCLEKKMKGKKCMLFDREWYGCSVSVPVAYEKKEVSKKSKKYPFIYNNEPWSGNKHIRTYPVYHERILT